MICRTVDCHFYLFIRPTLQQLFEWGVDYVEVVNQNTFDYQSYRFAIENGMGIISGSFMYPFILTQQRNGHAHSWWSQWMDYFTCKLH